MFQAQLAILFIYFDEQFTIVSIQHFLAWFL